MDVGTLLRKARERRGLTLRELARTTKVPLSALQAIDREDMEQLPHGPCGRGFLRSYANEVGLDASDVLQAYDERFGEVETVISVDSGRVIELEESRKPANLVAALALMFAIVAVHGAFFRSPSEALPAALRYPAPPVWTISQQDPLPVTPPATVLESPTPSKTVKDMAPPPVMQAVQSPATTIHVSDAVGSPERQVGEDSKILPGNAAYGELVQQALPAEMLQVGESVSPKDGR
jgi:cytoskeletal protein RodZ